MGRQRGCPLISTERLLGGGRRERDEPAGDALVEVEVAIGDACHVGRGDFGHGGVEGVVERPIACGDVFVEIAGDGEVAVTFVGGGGFDFTERGGDLGWNRRGVMVPEFDRAMFAFGPGQIVPVVIKTTLGYHVIKVDRVQPAEVKARHVLIMPKLDSADVARAHTLADSVQKLWKGGMPYDSVVAKFHDNGELTSYADQYPIETLPPEYKTAAGDAKSGEFGKLFEIANPQTGFPKVVVLRVTERTEGGAMTKADIRDRIRQQLVQEKQYRRMYDQLRKEQYVVIRM